MNEETPSGKGTTHSTHGIVIQELVETSDLDLDETVSSASVADVVETVPEASVSQAIDKTIQTKKKFKYVDKEIPPCFAKKRAEPVLKVSNTDINNSVITSNPSLMVSTEFLWTLCRALLNAGYTVPEWSGWVSKTTITQSSENTSNSTVGYLPPILKPITESATVQECLVIAQQVSEEVKQEYTLVTMDLAAAKIAYDVIFGSGDRFSKVILNLGPFHIMCSYMGALGKFMTGSGFEDVIIESGICASGSINQVLSGKHYNRAMRVHQYMLDALQRLLLKLFTATTGLSLDDEMVSQLARDPSDSRLVEAAQSDNCVQFFTRYKEFAAQVKRGEFGKTAQFWLQYCDCVWILLTFQRSVKENDFPSFVHSLRQLCDLLFAADHQNYARYLPLYYAQLTSLPANHAAAALFRNGGFSVSRSNVPGCRNPVDLTIEQTINRAAKTPGGIIGL